MVGPDPVSDRDPDLERHSCLSKNKLSEERSYLLEYLFVEPIGPSRSLQGIALPVSDVPFWLVS